MNLQLFTSPLYVLGLFGLCTTIALSSCSSTRQDIGQDDHPMSKPQSGAHAQGGDAMKLPPGWTQADMDACMAAGTPGPKQQWLARSAGRWSGTNTMWMAPDTEPMKSPCTSTISSVMDGHFTRWEFAGDIPGMGPYQGLGFSGYDNAAQKFVGTWLDNHSTGIMTGDATESSDGNTLTWTYHFTCPITKRPAVMREVQRHTGDNSITLDMYGSDPKSGKEYQMMHVELTRQGSS